VFFNRQCAGCGVPARLLCRSCRYSVENGYGPIVVSSLVDAKSEQVKAAFSYEDPVDKMILAAKNGGRRDVLRFLAGWLPLDSCAQYEVVGWVPASSKRKRERGYDQGRDLARHVANRLGIRHRKLLKRKPGESQAGLGRDERLKGPHFQIYGQPPSRVLLVDDVITTGASLGRARSVLRSAGVLVVDAVVVAAAN